MPRTDPLVRIFCGAAIGAIVVLSLYGTRPPAAVGLAAAPNEFSAARAMLHLQHFAEHPHPVGTEANRGVRDYLIETLKGLGAETQLEDTTGVITRGRFVRAGSVQNIIATFRGHANSRAVMLVAHYDSVPEGPGAADDGAGVISILETVRALGAGAPLKNDLIVLFTDGEEAGLLGAAGFVADHPDLANVAGVVLNLETRGSSGPAMMFETSDQNGWLIPEFARAAPHPMASSLMYSVYKLLPNDTDLSELKTAGVAALNFAFTESFQNYHTRLDTPKNLDARSVQQMGANALGLVRHFGDLPLADIRKADCIYFNWLGTRLLVYPIWIAWMLTASTFVLLALAVVKARQRGMIELRWATLSAFFLLLVAVAGAMLLPWSAVRFFVGKSLLRGDTPSNQLLFAGLCLFGYVGGNSILVALRSKFGARTLFAGLLLVEAGLAAVVLYLLPGASYLFQWPVFFGTGSLLLGLRGKGPKDTALWGMVAAVPALLILAPLTYLFLVNLDLNIISILAAAMLLSLLLAAAWPVFDFIYRPWGGVTMTLVVAALALVLGGASLSHFSVQHPRGDSLFYSLDVDQGKAKWISYDEATDAWTQQFLVTNPRKGSDPAFTAGSDHECLAADAPPTTFEAPVATVISDRVQDGTRILRLRLASPRHATTIVMRLRAEVDLQSVAYNGRSREVHASGKHPWSLRYEAVPPEGVDLELRFHGQSPLECWVADSTPGLPEAEGHVHNPRPDDLMADTGSDNTLVTRRYIF